MCCPQSEKVAYWGRLPSLQLLGFWLAAGLPPGCACAASFQGLGGWVCWSGGVKNHFLRVQFWIFDFTIGARWGVFCPSLSPGPWVAGLVLVTRRFGLVHCFDMPWSVCAQTGLLFLS